MSGRAIAIMAASERVEALPRPPSAARITHRLPKA